MKHELFVFFGMILCGAALSVLFDLRRGVQKSAKLPDFAVTAADLLFWIICAAAVTWCIWRLNSGIVRIYEFTGLILGSILYFFTLSKTVVKLSAAFTARILKIFAIIFKILLTPIRFLYKIIYSIYSKIHTKKEELADNE